jgi:hypothetical protein
VVKLPPPVPSAAFQDLCFKDLQAGSLRRQDDEKKEKRKVGGEEVDSYT